MEQSQTELKVPVLGSGRLQSEISWKQKEGYSQHTYFFK